MAQNELTNFFNIMFDKRQAFEISEGILQDKRGLTGRVSFVGNPVSQEAFIMQGATVSQGNRCLCVRPKTSAKWIVIGSFGTRQHGYLPQRSPEEGFELYPPAAVVPLSAIPGCCLWYWSTPPEKPITFEVQTNTVGSENGSEAQVIRTRGSYWIQSTAVNLFARVRTVTSDYNYSSWSAWVECAPAAAASGGTVTSVAVTVPAELSVAGSPITSTGTFAITWATETANKIFAGPVSGGAAVPTFRDSVLNDLPSIASQKLVGRYTAGAGKMEELIIGAGLYLVSDTLYASASGGGGESLWTEEIGFLHPITTTNRVVIGAGTIDDSAALEVSSTTGGILVPRMTTAQRNALVTPPVGMMIFNTDTNAFEFFQETITSPMSTDDLLEMIWIGGF